nr:hypothetical protein [Tanacetum cinerariifolium]
MMGNEVGQSAVQNPGIQIVENIKGLSVVSKIPNQYGNGNVKTTPAEGNGNGINGIQSTQEEFKFMAATDAYEESERVKVNYTSEDTLQQASTSGTQSENALVYDSDKSTEQSILEKPPSSYKPKLYHVTPFPKSSVLPKVDKMNALSKPVTSNSAPFTQELKVVQTVNVIAPRIFRTNPSKTSRVDNVVPTKPVKISIRKKPITVSQPNVIHKQQANSDSNSFSSNRVNNTTKTIRPYPRSNSNTNKVPSKTKSSCLSNNVKKIKENHRNFQIPKNQKHMSSECNNIVLTIQNAKSEIVCVMCKQCLVTANHDVCVLNYVNDMDSRADNQSANASVRKNQKKHKANAKKLNELRSKGSLASSRPRKPRNGLRWIPTGRIFAMCRKLTASSNTENKSKKSVRDNAREYNNMVPSACTPVLPRLRRKEAISFQTQELGMTEVVASVTATAAVVSAINGTRCGGGCSSCGGCKG